MLPIDSTDVLIPQMTMKCFYFIHVNDNDKR